MPTSKHWVIPNTIPYASPSLKTLYSSATSGKMPIHVQKERQSKADCLSFNLIDYVVILPASGIFPRRCRRRGGSRGHRHAWRAAFRAD